LIMEENYFFKISKYIDEIRKKIESDELEIYPRSRKNEILAMIYRGVEDISFSRPKDKLSWGIDIPNDDTQVMYVWCDALSNYISALGFGTDEDEDYKKFWPADLHIVGKDILRFHAIIWPAMLLSAGLSLPKKIFVHGFLNSGGKKMSKSLGNVITPEEIIEEYGAEALRYYLLREVTSYEDGDITKEKFKTAYNANLANGLGNLTSRIMKMAENNLDKPVDIEREVVPSDFLNNLDFHKFMDYVWEQISETDLYIQETEPFKLIKINPAQAKDVIRDLVQKLNSIAVLLEPVMPESAQKIQNAIKENRMPSEPLFLRK